MSLREARAAAQAQASRHAWFSALTPDTALHTPEDVYTLSALVLPPSSPARTQSPACGAARGQVAHTWGNNQESHQAWKRARISRVDGCETGPVLAVHMSP